MAIFPQLGHTDMVFSAGFSPDGRTLASGSHDDTIKVWDVASGRELKTLSAVATSAVAVSPQARTIASVSFGDTIKLWDVASAHVFRILSGHSSLVNSVAFSPNGRTLASGSSDHTIKLWDVASGRELRTLSGFAGEVSAVAFSPDGRTLASGSHDDTIKVWDLASGRELKTLSGHSDEVYALAFFPDGRTLASGDKDNTIKLWDVASGHVLKTLDADASSTVALSPGMLASVSRFTIKLLDLASGRELMALGGHGSEGLSVAFSPDGRTLAAGNEDRTVRLWHLASGQALEILKGHSDAVASVAFSPDGHTLASGSWDHTIKLWDVATGRGLKTLSGHTDWVSSVAFSPDGRVLASGSSDHGIKLWDVASGRVLKTLSDASAVTSVAFSPDGRTTVSGSGLAITLWDTATGRYLKTFSGHTGFVTSIAFSPDGRALASGSYDHTLKLWDVASGHELGTLSGHTDIVRSVVFSRDGKTLASGSDDKTIKLWDVASGRERTTLSGHGSFVYAVAFSPSGRTLASGSGDHTLRLWAVTTSKDLVSLIGFVDGSSIAVTPEGFFNSSSEQAEENLNVRIGNRVFGISSFRDNFYRPDLVQKALAGEDLSRFGSIDKVKLSPDIEFANLPSSTIDPNLNLTLHLTDGGGGFGAVQVQWNGTVVKQDDSLPVSGETLTLHYPVALLSGENALRVKAYNADWSMWSDVQATVSLPAPKRAANAHGTLHALAIGIQVFPNSPENNLKYAASDATMIAETLTQRAAPLFNKLDIRPPLTTPAETDKAHIVEAIKAMQTSTGPNDEFVFFISSHGIVADNQYYVIASDMTGPPNPSNLSAHALSTKELNDLLGNVGAGRKLVILDTCYAGAAGNLLAAGSATRNATIFGRDLGSTVLAAANSQEEALEGGIQNHGLFSYVLNDGLSGKAVDEATGVVTSLLLADFVKKQVPLQAQSVLHREQHPTAEPSGQSFAITKVR